MKHVPVSALLLGAVLVGSQALAQSYPSKPVRLVVPFPPGGAPDLVARALGPRLHEELGQPVVVDNRAGAAGIIAMEIVAKSPADGHVLVMGSAGPVAINPGLYRKLPYDVLRDFAPVSRVTALPFLLVVHPSLPVKSIRDLLALAKAKPGELNYGSPGNGSTTHLATELLKSMTGVKITHIPYKGVAAAATDLMAGQVQILSGDLNTMLPHVKSGRMRGIAVTSERRSPVLPDMPTIAQSGVPGFEATGWTGLLAPAGTPPAIVQRLSATVAKALETPDTRSRVAALGGEVASSTPEAFAAYIRSEIAKWGKLIQSLGIQSDAI